MSFSRRLAGQLLKTRFVAQAVREKADLSVFRQKPSGRMIIGLVCIAVSYAICWPVITALSVFAIFNREPLLIIISGPVIWIVAHFLCMFGLTLAGMDHFKALLKWLARIFVEKHAPDRVRILNNDRSCH